MLATILKTVPSDAPDNAGAPPNAAADPSRPHMSAYGPKATARPPGNLAYSAAIALCALLLGLTASAVPVAAMIGAAGAGALCILRKKVLAAMIAIALIAMALFAPADLLPDFGFSLGYWLLIGLMLGACVFPIRATPSLLRVSPLTWASCMVLAAASIQGSLLGTGHLSHFFTILGCLCGALLGAGLTRHLAMMDARILTWGEEGLGSVTRDLLLGRITSGMLHDLSQPLNVIAMANGNMGYIVEHLDVQDSTRQQLLDRIARISTHTESASTILTLFRWFGRSGRQEETVPNVRNALTRAIAATRSNVRHHGIEVEIDGNALDHLIPHQQGRLEMMAVAALLSAFGAYSVPRRERMKGRITLFATTSPAYIVIQVQCLDENGRSVPGEGLDNATLWLVEQVALEAGGDFRCLAHRNGAVQFVIRLARDDI